MTFDDLKNVPLIYLASPYSKYPTGLEMAFRDVSALAGKLLAAGLKVYSPIAHTHPIAIYSNLDPYDHKIWLPFDAAIMGKADVLLVAHMATWDKSFGIAHEIDVFKAAGKPVLHLDPVSLELIEG